MYLDGMPGKGREILDYEVEKYIRNTIGDIISRSLD